MPLDFAPDFTPEQLREQGVYDEVYGDGPRLASLGNWPQSWIHPQDPKGWLQWFERYAAGRRTDDDKRQIQRWHGVKSRHGGALRKNPTPRRAYALRNWAIDPEKLVEPDAVETLKKMMIEYRDKKYKKADGPYRERDELLQKIQKKEKQAINIAGVELSPTLIRLSMGIPGAGVGGLLGALTAPKKNRWEGAARGASMGYIAGTGAGIGSQLGHAATDAPNKLPYMLSGGLAGGVLGLGAGGLMHGPSPWVKRQQFRDELISILRDEADKIKQEVKRKPKKEKSKSVLEQLATGFGSLGKIGTDKVAEQVLHNMFGKRAVGPALAGLQQAKLLSDKRRYSQKHNQLRQLIKQYPKDFYIDSVDKGIAGITHRPTGFKIHAPINILPSSFRGVTNGSTNL